MSATEIRGSTQVKDGTVTDAKLVEDYINSDGSVPWTADQSVGGFKLTSLATGVAGTDAVNVDQLNALSAGLSWKQTVIACTTVNGVLATAFEDGDIIDGVTLSTGDRILIKAQTAGQENGIYVVAASGAPTRATDADSETDLVNAATFCSQGTVNADQAFVMTTDAPIVVDTTPLVWVQFTGTGQITAGLGLTKTGNTLDVGAGDGIIANADDIEVKPDTTKDSIDVTSAGVALKDGAGAQFYLADSSGVFKRVTLSGDITVSDTGVVTVTGGDFITRETPSGAIDGANTTFTLANTPVVGSEEFYINGILMNEGAGNDYTISGVTITTALAPKAAPGNPDVLLVSYRK